MIVSDFLGVSSKKKKQIEKFIRELSFFLQKMVPPIELWEHPRAVYSQKEIKAIQKNQPEFIPDNLLGEYSISKGVIIIYALALNRGLPQIKRTLYHEFAHWIFHKIVNKNLFLFGKWNRARRLDKERGFSCLNRKEREYEGIYGFDHLRTREESFAETLAYFWVNPVFLQLFFSHRFAFCQELIKILEKKFKKGA